jgi:thiomorpholine-carboxylate dehydrogenase
MQTSPPMPMYLDEVAVARHLRMDDLIPAMEKALVEFSCGKVDQPARSSIAVDPPGGFFFWMPVRAEALGLKIVTLYPPNAARGLPTHMATIFLCDLETGAPLAVMDGRLITEMRTAAVSAVATKLCAAPDARVLAILGSGVQAQSHIDALRRVRSFDEVRIWSRTPEHARRLAAQVGGTAASTAEDAVRGADVVVTATSAREPVLQGAWLKRGCHVNAVGAPRPDWRELDDAAMGNVLFVDSHAGALQESGDVILSNATIHAEIGAALAGRAPARRDETTVFKSLGMAVEDVAAAMLVYEAARKSAAS